MDLKRARTFVTVAELGTVSKAATRLRIAQPALSRHIRDLEGELGLMLFDRIGRRLMLTREGEQLLTECRSLLNYAAEVDERARLLRRGDVSVLKVAASPQHIEGVLSQLLPRFAKQHPNVQVRLIEAVGQDNLAMVERGEIHLGQNLVQAVKPTDERFARRDLASVELLAACQLPFTLGKRTVAIEIARLGEYPLLLLSPDFSVRRTFDAACRLAGFTPNIQFESRTPHTILALAEAGQGVAIIPSGLRTHRYQLQVARVSYQGQPISEQMTVFWDKRRPLPPHAASFCDMWTDYVRRTFPLTRPTSGRNKRR